MTLVSTIRNTVILTLSNTFFQGGEKFSRGAKPPATSLGTGEAIPNLLRS